LLIATPVARDHIEPCRELGIESKGVEARVGLDEDFLRQIRRQLTVAREPVTPRHDPREMAVKQFVDQPPGSLRGWRESVLGDELLV
jgi:hypothetical protein